MSDTSKPSEKGSLSHLDDRGAARQVDVSGKPVTSREAVAEGFIVLPEAAYKALKNSELEKGDALAVARIAAIQGAKKTSDLVPLCHQVALSSVAIDFEFDDDQLSVRVVARARTEGQTGVEMEAIMAVSIGTLTLYDMTKGVDKGSVIRGIRLLSKSGGKSGNWTASCS